MLIGFAGVAFAQASLEVTFDPDPLFNKPNFLPGDEANGEVTVTNNSGETQNILTEAINVLDNDNFASLLHLKIEGGALFDDSLANFFSTAGEVSLGSILSGESKIFTYTISFIDSDDNSYQGKTLGFDVCVGFSGGTKHCGDTVVGDENDTDDGGGGGGGGSSGGSGGGVIILVITNEQAETVLSLPTAMATITWDTNILATSQVVYGLLSGGPYTLNMDAINFGYSFGTTEDPTKVLYHSMLLTGLIPGETYLYRVVSRASPPTISPEHQFTAPLLTQADNAGLVLGASTVDGGGSVLGSDSNGTLGDVLGEATDSPTLNENLAAVLASSFDDLLSICTLIVLLILLVIYLVWRLWLRKEYEKNLVAEEEIKNRFYLFFGGSSLLAIFIFLILGKYCPLPVLILAFVISICLYAYRKLRIK